MPKLTIEMPTTLGRGSGTENGSGGVASAAAERALGTPRDSTRAFVSWVGCWAGHWRERPGGRRRED